MSFEPGETAVNAIYNAGYDTGYGLGRESGYCMGWEAGERFARQHHDRILSVAITAIELRTQQLASRVGCSDIAVELDWVLELLGDIES